MKGTQTYEVLRILFFGFLYIAIAMGLLYLSWTAVDKWAMRYEAAPLAGINGLAGFIGEFIFGSLIFICIFVLALFIFLFAIPRSAMPHIIYSRPMKLEPNDFFGENIQGQRISRVDDKFIIYEYKTIKFTYWFFGIITAFCCFTIFLVWVDGEFFKKGTGIFCAATLGFLGCFISIVIRPVKRVVFDRMNGTVSLPGIFGGLLPRNTIPFSKVKVGISYGSMVFQYAKYLHIGVTVWYEYNAETWYMLLQYMDKNYPLPRGTVFDPYREQDFKRRQSEGFPKPKCMSYVWLMDETCGYINASNGVRERIGKFKKVDIFRAYKTVQEIVYSLTKKYMTQKHSEIALVGIYENNYVFKLFDGFHGEIIEYTKDMLSDCFLVSGTVKDKAEYIAPR